ncbi:MAG: hypothetical protein KAS49_04790, partial [Candidatus Cloacimonetes bacterium]|nr:hypothetical protein [Candidatus Cloacimonadota bacterium]
YPEIKQDRIAIEKQICELVKNGHDVQLHLHPHWLDAKYVNGNWAFNYERFSLHSLLKEKNADDIDTILGCVTITKKLIESIIHKIDENYKVYAFRAGGYLIEPFNEIREALLMNEIYVDSSVCPSMKNQNYEFSYNFEKTPRKIKYRFNDNINIINKNGRFIEIPILAVKISLFRRIYNAIKIRVKYEGLESGRIGTGSGASTRKKDRLLLKVVKFLFKGHYQMLTTDNSFEEKYSYLLNRSKEYSTQILHPKLLNAHTLGVLNNKLENKEVRFVTIKDYLNE